MIKHYDGGTIDFDVSMHFQVMSFPEQDKLFFGGWGYHVSVALYRG
jgi:hypothetical protein